MHNENDFRFIASASNYSTDRTILEADLNKIFKEVLFYFKWLSDRLTPHFLQSLIGVGQLNFLWSERT